MLVLGLMCRWPKRVWIGFDLLYFEVCGFSVIVGRDLS